MFTLTIAVGNASWPLVYKTEESANAAVKNLRLMNHPDDCVSVEDDFGQIACVKNSSWHGFLVEDMEKVKLAHIERMIYSNHLQIDAQARGRSDPKIRAAATGGGGPAIVSPFGGNGRLS